MPNIFPTSYPNKGSADNTDKVFSSDGATNFNLTVGEIGTKNFADKTTSNLAEGTNKYVTNTNLQATSTITDIQSDITGLGTNKENVVNKKTDFSAINDVGYATTQAIVNYIAALGLDIEGLPAETLIADGDELAFYDVSATSNKKINLDNQRRSLESKQYLGLVASDTLQASANTERSYYRGGSSDSNSGKLKEIQIANNYRKGGNIRIKVDSYIDNSNGRVDFYKNGAEVDTQTTTGSYATYTYDMSVAEGDLIQIYTKNFSSSSRSYVKNFRIYYDEVAYTKTPTINLD